MSDTARATTAVPWRRAGLIVTAALVVKLVVLFQLWDHPLLAPHGELDTAYYVALSERIATEGVLASTGAFIVSPLYVYFLAVVYAAGGTLLAAQLVQVGLGALAVGVLFATACHWFGRRAALAAAALAILTGFFTFSEVLILQSALDPFLVSCALYSLTRTMAGGGPWAFGAAGASLGLLALNRPNALVFAGAAAAAVFVVQWRQTAADHASRGTRVARAAILLASLLAVLAANAVRNYAVSGQAVVIASHGGLNLYIGNHDRADGTYTPVPDITPSIFGQASDATRVAESAAGRTLTPAEVSNYFTRRAVDWVTAHPADALRLWIRKIGILLNRVDVPLNYSYAFYAREPASFLRVLAVGPWLILPFGLIGLCWPALGANRRGYWVWAMFVPVYGAAVVLFFVSDRYRMPLLVPLCATAGAALVRFFDLARARQFVALRMPAAAVAVVALVTFANLGLDSGLGGEQTRKAVWLVEQGSFDEARRYVEQVANQHSHPGVLRFRVGQALLDARRHDEAADLLAQAMAIDGPRPAIRLALGEALVGAGRAAAAIAHLEATYDSGYDSGVAGPLLVRALGLAGRPDDAVRRFSDMPDSVVGNAAEVSLDFGTLALERGAIAEATPWLRLAVERAPDRAEAHEKLGLAIFLQGDPRTALPHLERALRLDPAQASAHLNLAVLYAELGRFADARKQAAEALRLDPAEPRAADLLKALPK
ncbi:MAG: tetratricopeptide repeat protein [Acidobacteriota bacterium]|nr:tetratricopeptide repeat protein [Acidobacteriota bacterium]